jgi:hypothetical protein
VSTEKTFSFGAAALNAKVWFCSQLGTHLASRPSTVAFSGMLAGLSGSGFEAFTYFVSEFAGL